MVSELKTKNRGLLQKDRPADYSILSKACSLISFKNIFLSLRFRNDSVIGDSEDVFKIV